MVYMTSFIPMTLAIVLLCCIIAAANASNFGADNAEKDSNVTVKSSISNTAMNSFYLIFHGLRTDYINFTNLTAVIESCSNGSGQCQRTANGVKCGRFILWERKSQIECPLKISLRGFVNGTNDVIYSTSFESLLVILTESLYVDNESVIVGKQDLDKCTSCYQQKNKAVDIMFVKRNERIRMKYGLCYPYNVFDWQTQIDCWPQHLISDMSSHKNESHYHSCYCRNGCTFEKLPSIPCLNYMCSVVFNRQISGGRLLSIKSTRSFYVNQAPNEVADLSVIAEGNGNVTLLWKTLDVGVAIKYKVTMELYEFGFNKTITETSHLSVSFKPPKTKWRVIIQTQSECGLSNGRIIQCGDYSLTCEDLTLSESNTSGSSDQMWLVIGIIVALVGLIVFAVVALVVSKRMLNTQQHRPTYIPDNVNPPPDGGYDFPDDTDNYDSKTTMLPNQAID